MYICILLTHNCDQPIEDSLRLTFWFLSFEAVQVSVRVTRLIHMCGTTHPHVSAIMTRQSRHTWAMLPPQLFPLAHGNDQLRLTNFVSSKTAPITMGSLFSVVPRCQDQIWIMCSVSAETPPSFHPPPSGFLQKAARTPHSAGSHALAWCMYIHAYINKQI